MPALPTPSRVARLPDLLGVGVRRVRVLRMSAARYIDPLDAPAWRLALRVLAAWLLACVVLAALSASAHGADVAGPPSPTDPVGPAADAPPDVARAVGGAVGGAAISLGVPEAVASLLAILIPILIREWFARQDRLAARALVAEAQRRRQAAVDRGDEDEAKRIAVEAKVTARAMGAESALAAIVRRNTKALDRSKINGAQPGAARGGAS